MKRSLASVAAVLAAGALTFGAYSAPAQATDLNDAYAAAAKVLPGAGGTAAITTGGVVGALLAPVTNVLTQVINPLATQLNGLSSVVVSDLASLAGADGSATSSDIATAPPADGYPTCNTPGWDVGNCYGPSGPSVSAAPIIAVTAGSMQGYATANSTGSFTAARAVNYQLSALGISIGNLGVSESTATCNAALVCSSTASITGMSLLNNQLGVQTAPDGSLQVSVNNAAYVNVSTLTAPLSLNVPGLVSASVQANGAGITVKVGLSLHNLLIALGIPDALGTLNALDAGSVVTLSLNIGATHITTSSNGTGYGLSLGLGLGVNAQVSVLGLASIGLTFTDTPTGNLASLQLAYTSATDANPAAPKPVKAENK